MKKLLLGLGTIAAVAAPVAAVVACGVTADGVQKDATASSSAALAAANAIKGTKSTFNKDTGVETTAPVTVFKSDDSKIQEIKLPGYHDLVLTTSLTVTADAKWYGIDFKKGDIVGFSALGETGKDQTLLVIQDLDGVRNVTKISSNEILKAASDKAVQVATEARFDALTVKDNKAELDVYKPAADKLETTLKTVKEKAATDLKAALAKATTDAEKKAANDTHDTTVKTAQTAHDNAIYALKVTAVDTVPFTDKDIAKTLADTLKAQSDGKALTNALIEAITTAQKTDLK